MTFEQLLALVTSEYSTNKNICNSADDQTLKKPRICIDSGKVQKGDIFVAIAGSVADGHDYIPKAIENGAAYIVYRNGYSTGRSSSQSGSVEIIGVQNTATAAAILAQASKGNPASKLNCLAVTGTNGKTTVAFLVHSIIKAAGENCGLIGTILYDDGKNISPATLTTPDSILIADLMSRMVANNADYVITEASSHALYQNRLGAIDFSAAAFTNLTGDHLDYHKDQRNYLAAKTILFENLKNNSFAVLNSDSPYSKLIAEKTQAKLLWYGIELQEDNNSNSANTRVSPDISAAIRKTDIDGTTWEIRYKNASVLVDTPLIGLYNVSNCLAAAGICIAAGFNLQQIATGIENLKAIPGRLEKLQVDTNYTVLIDYAHTDDALKNVLSALKPLCKGKLKVVFGCGGDRDNSKRPRMARVAELLADEIFVTSDNPRTELPEYIIGEIITGFENPVHEKITVEPDRKLAIKLAVDSAQKDDIILIAGKGHEDYQIIGDQKIDFSDKIVAAKCIEGAI